MRRFGRPNIYSTVGLALLPAVALCQQAVHNSRPTYSAAIDGTARYLVSVYTETKPATEEQAKELSRNGFACIKGTYVSVSRCAELFQYSTANLPKDFHGKSPVGCYQSERMEIGGSSEANKIRSMVFVLPGGRMAEDRTKYWTEQVPDGFRQEEDPSDFDFVPNPMALGNPYAPQFVQRMSFSGARYNQVPQYRSVPHSEIYEAAVTGSIPDFPVSDLAHIDLTFLPASGDLVRIPSTVAWDHQSGTLVGAVSTESGSYLAEGHLDASSSRFRLERASLIVRFTPVGAASSNSETSYKIVVTKVNKDAVAEALGRGKRLSELTAQAKHAYDQHNYTLALSVFTEASKLDPYDSGLLNWAGCAASALAETARARDFFTSAVSQAPFDATIRDNLGLALEDINDLDGALVQFEKASELDPDSTLHRIHIGDVQYAKGNFASAVESYGPVINSAGADVKDRYGLALLKQNRTQDAASILSAVTTSQPDVAKYHFDLGTVWQAAGKYKDALKEYTAASGINGSETKFKEAASEVQKLIDTEVADRAEQQKNADALLYSKAFVKALPIYRRLLADDPNNHQLLTGFALCCFNCQIYNECSQSLSQIAYKDQNANEAAMLGEALYHQNQTSRALDAFTHAAQLQPSEPAWVIGECKCLVSLGRAKDAEALLRNCLEIKPNDIVAKGLLAVALRLEGKVKEAEAAFKEVTTMAPDNEQYHLSFAELLFSEKKVDAAKKEFQAALKLDPNNPVIKQYISLCDKQHGKSILGFIQIKSNHN